MLTGCMKIVCTLALICSVWSAFIPPGNLSARITGDNITTSEAPSSLQKRAFPPYMFETQFELMNFRPDYANAIKTSSIGVIVMVNHALGILTSPANDPVPTNPSYPRYFEPQDIDNVKRVLQTLLAVLGAPGAENAAGCLRVPKLQIWYDWHRLKPLECKDPNRDVLAAVSRDELNRSYMIICNTFFDGLKRFDLVDCDALVADGAIDMGLVNEEDIPAFSGSITFMHELLHWTEMTIAAGTAPIVDAVVVRNNNNMRTVAYRAFYAMKMKDIAWLPNRPATQNADNYVFMVLELFYGTRCPSVLPWNDPPDSRLEFPPQ